MHHTLLIIKLLYNNSQTITMKINDPEWSSFTVWSSISLCKWSIRLSSLSYVSVALKINRTLQANQWKCYEVVLMIHTFGCFIGTPKYLASLCRSMALYAPFLGFKDGGLPSPGKKESMRERVWNRERERERERQRMSKLYLTKVVEKT